MTVRMNGEGDGAVSAFDRGLMYGDGVFETMWAVGGRIPLLEWHFARLTGSLDRLAIPPIDEAAVRRQLDARAAEGEAVVIKLIVTRGVSARGYAIDAGAKPTIIVSSHAHVARPPGQTGIAVRICDLRLSEQPLLAGLKHLNRLEQVLARAEWSAPAIAEGLCLDAAGRVICATAANLFAVIDGQVVTPSVDRCGVAGVARQFVIGHEPVLVRDMLRDELVGASEVFLSNAVRGIVPVTGIEDSRYAIGPNTRRIAARFAALGIGATP